MTRMPMKKNAIENIQDLAQTLVSELKIDGEVAEIIATTLVINSEKIKVFEIAKCNRKTSELEQAEADFLEQQCQAFCELLGIKYVFMESIMGCDFGIEFPSRIENLKTRRSDGIYWV